jgi:hypothetical protein
VKFNKDFLEISGTHIEIGVMSKPQKGKANTEIIKKLANHFHVSSSHVRIVAGMKSKSKIVEII